VYGIHNSNGKWYVIFRKDTGRVPNKWTRRADEPFSKASPYQFSDHGGMEGQLRHTVHISPGGDGRETFQRLREIGIGTI
jgi:hypothetical protein